MDALIFDRTLTDVETRTEKGYWQLADLIRITQWIAYLAGLYSLTVNATNHNAGDLIRWAELLEDIATIRAGHTFPVCQTYSATPQVPNKQAWNHTKANAVERILFDANLWFESREKLTKYTGTVTAGMDYEL